MNGGTIAILGLIMGAAGALVSMVVHQRWARPVGVGLLALAVFAEVLALQTRNGSAASDGAPALTTVPPTFLSPPPASSSSGRPSSNPLPSLNIQPKLLAQVHPGYLPILKPVVANREFVRISNHANHPIYLGGWHLSNGSVIYTFPGVTLPAGESLIVRTGPGTNAPGTLHWNLSSYVWHSPTGRITLRNAKGALVDTCIYHVLAGQHSAAC